MGKAWSGTPLLGARIVEETLPLHLRDWKLPVNESEGEKKNTKCDALGNNTAPFNDCDAALSPK